MFKTRIKIKKNIKGFSLVEVLLSVALFTLFVLGLSGGLAYSMQSSEVTSYKSKAVFLADEGLEAIRSIRNSDYNNLTSGTYGLDSTGATWSLIANPESIGEYSRSIEISDINSTTKQIISRVTWPATIGGSNSVQTSVYLTNWMREILQNWAGPTFGNTLDFSGNQDGIAIAQLDNFAYVVRGSGTPNFITINISGAIPNTISSSNITATPTGISVSAISKILAVTSSTNSSELYLFDVSNASSPVQISTYNAPGNADAISSFISNNNLYVGRLRSKDDEFIILNIADPAAPTLVGSADFSEDLTDIVVDGNYAYVSTNNKDQELIIFDVSNPSSPNQIGSYNVEGNVQGTSLYKFNNTILLGTSVGNVHLIDASNTATPTLIGTYSSGSNSRINDISIKTDNSMMFIARGDNSDAFIAVSLANPNSPIKLSSLNATSAILGLVYDPIKDSIYGVSSENSSEFIVINSK